MCVWAQWGSKSVPGSPHDPPVVCKCKITTKSAICDGRVDELEYQVHSIEQKKNSLCSKTVKSNVTPPHCEAAIGIHNKPSIVPETRDHKVFKKIQFENSNSNSVTAARSNVGAIKSSFCR